MRPKPLVAEPFDFEAPSGPNLLYAESYAQGNGEFGEYVLCSCEPFAKRGLVVLGLMLIARHKNRNFITDLTNGLDLNMNAGNKYDGGLWTQEDVERSRSDGSLWGGFIIVSGHRVDA